MNHRHQVLVTVAGAGIAALVLSVAGAQTASFRVVSKPYKIRSISSKAEPRLLNKELGRASGLAWQPPNGSEPGRLWIAFEEVAKLASLNSTDPKAIVFSKPSQTQFVPGLLAFDYRGSTGSGSGVTGTRLWSINKTRSKVNRGISTNMAGQDTGGLPGFAPTEGKTITDRPHRSKINGFFVDPKRPNPEAEHYVVCRAGGLCSTIEVRRRSDDAILAQSYPGCEPMGMAIDPSGERLWILADRGPGIGPVLLERRLVDSPIADRFRSASGPTKTIRQVLIRGRAVAIAATENSVWVLSNGEVLANGVVSERAFVAEFIVGSGS
jgi:hypothetical protein